MGNVDKKHVFIVGSKGIPANYGGFEMFVDKLTEYQKNENIKYHVSCICTKEEYDSEKTDFEYNGAHCFNLKERCSGPVRAIFYDIDAIKHCLKYIKRHNIKNAIIYVLACRIGPFMGYLKRKIRKAGAKLYVNPDGHEWKRAKWSAPVRKYWKISEKLMVKNADFLICDSKNIEKYIKEDYKQFNPKTTFIAYGAETSKSSLDDDNEELVNWYKKFDIKPKKFYLVVGRFVPENNFETMVKEFMKSKTNKDLVLITGYENNDFYNQLLKDTHFDKDKRIKFVGTVYEKELLKKIRQDAYGYLHGHSVGGTNPSLLEALGSTDLNLLYDVGFNCEVGEDGAMYWSREYGMLAYVIDKADSLREEEIIELSDKAKKRVDEYYSWEYIRDRYEELFAEEY